MNSLIYTLPRQGLAIAFLLTLTAVSSPQLADPGIQASTQPHTDSLEWHGNVSTKIISQQGEVISTSFQHNTVTEEGREWLSKNAFGQLSGDEDISFIGLSNASSFSASASHGFLDGEIEADSTNLTRGAATYTITKTGNGCREIEATWTADAYVDGIKGTGLFISDAQNTQQDSNVIMIAEAALSPVKILQDGYLYSQRWNVCLN